MLKIVEADLLPVKAYKVGKSTVKKGSPIAREELYPEQTKNSFYNLCQEYNRMKEDENKLKQRVKYKE